VKLLNGAALADFIKERQARQVRALRQADGIAPHLAIIRTNPDPVVDSYMKLKQSYGEDINVDVAVHNIDQSEAPALIQKLNKDEKVHGIIVQVPLPNPSQTDEILDTVAAPKDVDGLAAKTNFEPATPIAIDWLLAGYNINLKGKKIVIVGKGRLVGDPLARLWKKSDQDVVTLDRQTQNIAEQTQQADILICATGRPGLITPDMVKKDAVIVDAGVATDSNGLVGDVTPGVRELPNLTITPEKGGVGPLTVSALFENVIRAATKIR
jgi:methylenetetrahydrofolate dehydrogenase (NADP+)/methenyltetrahydrofolate cyclohydrolase